MEKFQGWTPKTIDNLTFQQLDAIFNVYINRSEKTKKATNKDAIKKIPSVTMTKEEKEAWIKAKMPSPISKFLKNYRRKNG